ncbi:unnamed protein product, partial [Scytosiphon promiscuus]
HEGGPTARRCSFCGWCGRITRAEISPRLCHPNPSQIAIPPTCVVAQTLVANRGRLGGACSGEEEANMNITCVDRRKAEAVARNGSISCSTSSGRTTFRLCAVIISWLSRGNDTYRPRKEDAQIQYRVMMEFSHEPSPEIRTTLPVFSGFGARP